MGSLQCIVIAAHFYFFHCFSHLFAELRGLDLTYAFHAHFIAPNTTITPDAEYDNVTHSKHAAKKSESSMGQKTESKSRTSASVEEKLKKLGMASSFNLTASRAGGQVGVTSIL